MISSSHGGLLEFKDTMDKGIFIAQSDTFATKLCQEDI